MEKIKNNKDDKNKKKINIKNNKIFIFILVTIIIIAIIVIMQKIKKNNNNNEYANNKIQQISEVLKNDTNENQEKINITNINIESNGATINVKSTIINKDSKIKKADVILYLYDSENDLRGKNIQKIENLEEGASIEITNTIIGGYSDLSRYEIKIENIER